MRGDYFFVATFNLPSACGGNTHIRSKTPSFVQDRRFYLRDMSRKGRDNGRIVALDPPLTP